MNIWEQMFRIAEQSNFEEGLTFEKARSILDDWMSFAKFHVLLQAAMDMNQEEAVSHGISPHDRSVARKMAASIKRCLNEIEPLEKSLKTQGDGPDPATKPTMGTPADVGSWSAKKK